MTVISSAANPRVRRWRRLSGDAAERRRQRRTIIEGEHLILACIQSGRTLECLMLSETASGRAGFMALARQSSKAPTILADPVFRSIVDAETPAGIAAEIAIAPAAQDLKSAAACVFLDAIQDAGNVGAILRSAAAFGIGHAVLGRGCADAWSPKVLRAGAGAHFAMEIQESAELDAAIASFGGKVACTVPRGGVAPASADLSGRIGWLLGAEGRGVSEALSARAALKVTIPMPGGAESLNVAAAAAICFYEFSRRGARA